MDKLGSRSLANGPVRRTSRLHKIHARMSAEVIISYDGTANDDDALVLAKLLVGDASKLALTYVRHAREFDPRREALAQHDAERRLEQGAARLGDPDIPRHVVFGASTGEGLEELAAAEGASVIVFGSDYRTPPGSAEPPTSAQRVLEIGATGIAIAAAGLRADPDAAIRSIAVLPVDGDDAAQQTASALAAGLDAQIVAGDPPAADLIVAGSRNDAPAGRLALSGSARTMLDASRGSVIVVPSRKPLRF
jgi:nucleotide-binding universal stress UspA family protein